MYLLSFLQFHFSILFCAGCDEAGRGPLAGPVVGAAVLILPGFFLDGITDSKKVKMHKMNILFQITGNK